MGSYWDSNGNLVDGRFDVQLIGSKVAEGIADMRLNTQGTLLASSARTGTVTSAIQTNYNWSGVLLYLNVTAASGTGGLVVRVYTTDPVSGANISVNSAPTAVVANGTTTYVVYPGCLNTNTTITHVSGVVLPRTWYAQVTHGDGSSYTYSLGYSLIL